MSLLFATRLQLFTVVAVACAVVGLAEWKSREILAEPRPAARHRFQPAKNVLRIPKDPAALPQAPSPPLVLMLGNSHTYSLPGLAPGEPLRSDVSKVVVDELADRVGQLHPHIDAQFDLLAYPNFLPFEMLTRVEQMLAAGYRPKVVIVGLTWRNIARDSELRHEIRALYRQPEFAQRLEEKLSALPQGNGEANDEVLAAVRREELWVQHDAEAERLESDADRFDALLTQRLASHLTLLGRSAELRSRLYRAVALRAQGFLIDERQGSYSYDLVAADYRFNLHCLHALLAMLRSSGAEVFCYFAPERTDLPALMDPQAQQDFMAQFERSAAALQVHVLDARHCVANEYWGWEGEAPDRSHFTEPGHQALADFLATELDAREVWTRLSP